MRLPDRAAIQALTGPGCMIRKDRAARAFFVSDYPSRLHKDAAEAASARLIAAGYALRPLEGLMLIDWTQARCLQCYDALPALPLPPYHLSDRRLYSICRLLMQHQAALEDQDASLLHQALRLYFAKDMPRLTRLLEQGLAEALRLHRAPPCHAARLLLHFGIQKTTGGTSC